jgi:coenzyme Q-binding protein COQ10
MVERAGAQRVTRYTERQHLPYSPQQLFDLVADVEKYPEFVPWLMAARIRRREGNTVWVDLEVGTNLLRKRFATRAVLHPPNHIEISSEDALFRRYDQCWTLRQATDGGTVVEFTTDFAFRSRLLQLTMNAFLQEAAAAMVNAFKHRARAIYGRGVAAQHATGRVT